VKGARGKKPKMELDFGRLVTLMEAVLFARTGIAMQIKATEGKPPKISGLTVTYIHLGWILPGTPGKVPLWDEVLVNSPKVVGTDDPKLVRLELYTRLQAMGPDPFIWKTGTGAYRFSDDFAVAYGKWRATRKPDLAKNLPVKGPAPPADIKTVPQFKNEYLNPTSQSGIGLRIGLHGGHSQQPTGEPALEKQSGTDRESHHMIQYLLVQFFRNDNKIKAWPSGVNYKGVMRKGGEVIDYQGATAGTLHLRKLDLGGKGKRGSAMPAILISSDAHRRGQVHVEKESQWSGDEGDPDSGDGQGRATQGYAIRNEFRKHQRALLQMDDENPG
jgi:Novel toxin 14